MAGGTGVETSAGGGVDQPPLVSAGSQGDTQAQVKTVVKDYGPLELDYLASHKLSSACIIKKCGSAT
jgi:hypothetical protein